MTHLHKTETYDKEHIHCGGIIYISDFNTDYRGKGNSKGSSIASRIESDLQWEKKLTDQSKERGNK